MREPTYLIIVALASMLVASPFSAFAQQDPPIVNPPIVDPPIVDLPIVAPPIVTGQPLRPQTFGGRVDTTAAPPPPSPPQQPKHAFYYHPGDLKGVPYNTIEDCTKARQRAGDVGVCMYK
jgi:hypothetical protein